MPRLDGNWGGELMLTGVAGGTGPARTAGALACVGAAFDKVVGERNDHTLTITQAGNDLTAKLVSTTTGLSCDYEGRVGSDKSFVLHSASCTQSLNILCPGALSQHTISLVGSSMTARFDDPVNPTSINGVAAHTYNVSGEGAMVANHSFSALTRR